jgi:hypothetical protein
MGIVRCRQRLDGDRWRAEAQQVRDRIAALEEQLRGLGVALPPAVTVAAEEGDQQAAELTAVGSVLSDDSDVEGEASMFENSWVEASGTCPPRFFRICRGGKQAGFLLQRIQS